MEKIKGIINKATNIVVLTGAGISTESGLPDFHSSQGLYKTLTTPLIFSKWMFRLMPGHFYKTMGGFYEKLLQAEPNAGHLALAALEKQGKKVTIITQNVDALHQKAGSTVVHEIHGTLDTMTCLKCHRKHSPGDFKDILAQGGTPHCQCGGVIKPDIVFFGDELPGEPLRQSLLAMLDAELVIVCGTSLKVSPANKLLSYRVEGTPVVIINRDPTPYDDIADFVSHGKIGDVLPELFAAIC